MEIAAIILASVAILLICFGKREKELYTPEDIPCCANCTGYAEGIFDGKEGMREQIVNRLMELKTRTKGTEHAMVVDILDMVRGL